MNVLYFLSGVIGLIGILLLKNKIKNIDYPYASIHTDSKDRLICSRLYMPEDVQHHLHFIIVGETVQENGDKTYCLIHEQSLPFGLKRKWNDMVEKVQDGQKISKLKESFTELMPLFNDKGHISSFSFKKAVVITQDGALEHNNDGKSDNEQ